MKNNNVYLSSTIAERAKLNTVASRQSDPEPILVSFTSSRKNGPIASPHFLVKAYQQNTLLVRLKLRSKNGSEH